MKKRINKKREYSRPQLEVIDVDHEISLVMFSIDNPPPSAFENPSGSESGPAGSYTSSEDNNPFGGSSPDYSN